MKVNYQDQYLELQQVCKKQQQTIKKLQKQIRQRCQSYLLYASRNKKTPLIQQTSSSKKSEKMNNSRVSSNLQNSRVQTYNEHIKYQQSDSKNTTLRQQQSHDLRKISSKPFKIKSQFSIKEKFKSKATQQHQKQEEQLKFKDRILQQYRQRLIQAQQDKNVHVKEVEKMNQQLIQIYQKNAELQKKLNQSIKGQKKLRNRIKKVEEIQQKIQNIYLQGIKDNINNSNLEFQDYQNVSIDKFDWILSLIKEKNFNSHSESEILTNNHSKECKIQQMNPTKQEKIKQEHQYISTNRLIQIETLQSSYQKQISILSQQVHNQQSIINNLNLKLENKINQSKNTIIIMDKDFKQQTQKLQTLQKQFQERIAQMNQLMKNKQQKHEAQLKARIQYQNKQYNDQIQKLKEQFVRKKLNYEEQIQDIKLKFKDKIQIQKQKQNFHHISFDQLEQNYRLKIQENEERQKTYINKLSQKFSQEKKQLQYTISQLEDSKIKSQHIILDLNKRIKAQIQKNKNDIQLMEYEYIYKQTMLKQQVNKLRSRLQEVQKEKNKIQMNYQNINQQKNELSKQIDILSQELKQQSLVYLKERNKIKQLQQYQIQKIKAQTNETTNRHKQLPVMEQVQELKVEKIQEKISKKEQDQQLRRLNQSYQNIVRQPFEYQTAQKSQIKREDTIIQKLQQQLKNKKNQLDRMNKELLRAKQLLEQSKKQIQNSRKQISKYKEEQQKSRQRKQQYEKARAQLQKSRSIIDELQNSKVSNYNSLINNSNQKSRFLNNSFSKQQTLEQPYYIEQELYHNPNDEYVKRSFIRKKIVRRNYSASTYRTGAKSQNDFSNITNKKLQYSDKSLEKKQKLKEARVAKYQQTKNNDLPNPRISQISEQNRTSDYFHQPVTVVNVETKTPNEDISTKKVYSRRL